MEKTTSANNAYILLGFKRLLQGSYSTQNCNVGQDIAPKSPTKHMQNVIANFRKPTQ